MANNLSSTLSVIDASDLTLRNVIELDGPPHQVRVVENAGVAVISVEGTSDLILLDTTTDTLVAEESTGLGGMVYLDTQPSLGGLVLAGGFGYGSHELALLQLATHEIRTLDLGPTIDVTAGVALHPNGSRGWAVHWSDPELLEFDTLTGSILRSVDFPYIDTRDLLVIRSTVPLVLKTDHRPRPHRTKTTAAQRH